ncbi:MAG: DUF134 domain-containing protein [Bacteroidetes bacterium]|nr:DUF134 domain-containing protein [Bacteroidota bacterium]
MPRPEKHRIVHEPPIFTEFKPIGVAGRFLERTYLSLDEFEAFRLADFVGLSHAEASDEMEISRSTFTRLIEKARKKIADLIIHGKVLTIDGGNIHFRNNIIRCYDCGHMFNINIKTSFTECPECKSTNLINLAGGFGHGRCCIISNNHKKGGNYARRRQNRAGR